MLKWLKKQEMPEITFYKNQNRKNEPKFNTWSWTELVPKLALNSKRKKKFWEIA